MKEFDFTLLSIKKQIEFLMEKEIDEKISNEKLIEDLSSLHQELVSIYGE